MVMGCTIEHKIPYAFELDFLIQSPLHSIHVDHGIHTIFSRMMAATHFLLRPPLPLLSVSPGYFPRTKGSGLTTPPILFFLSITYDKYVPTPGPMSNIGLKIYAIFVRMDSREL